MYIILRVPRGHLTVEYIGQYFSRDIAMMTTSKLAAEGHEDELHFVVEATVFTTPQGTDNKNEEEPSHG